MGPAALGRALGRAKLGPGPGDLLYAQALGGTDAFSAASRRAAGFQHRRARAEESDSEPQERAVLQDAERRRGGGLVHESDPHLRAERRQSLPLPDRTAPARRAVEAVPVGVDALELPRHPG